MSIRGVAREMRNQPTEAEKHLWQQLRKKQLKGFRFLRQHPIQVSALPVTYYIPDFICIKKKLIIEVDGNIHYLYPEEDKVREDVLRQKGFTIIRFSNEEVLKNTNEVLAQIENLF